MTERKLVLQGAINAAVNIIKSHIENFLELEKKLLSLTGQADINAGSSAPTSPILGWNPLGRLFPPSTFDGGRGAGDGRLKSELDDALKRDTRLFTQGLKSFVVGALNWVYESCVFFDEKGEEVRQFGWVFLQEKRDSLDENY
jgi:hypothetical protein